VEYLKDRAAQSMGKKIVTISPKLLNILSRQFFPGNIRELKTYIYDAVAQCSSKELTEHAIVERLSDGPLKSDPSCFRDDAGVIESLFGYFPTLAELTEHVIDLSLKKTNHNQTKAAQVLGISKQALSKRLKKRNMF